MYLNTCLWGVGKLRSQGSTVPFWTHLYIKWVAHTMYVQCLGLLGTL